MKHDSAIIIISNAIASAKRNIEYFETRAALTKLNFHEEKAIIANKNEIKELTFSIEFLKTNNK